jgi:hypothetical protein
MIKRPFSVSIIGGLYILAGVAGVVYHFMSPDFFGEDHLLILVIRILAIIGGIFVLRRSNWARWLIMAWIAYHVILSFWHSIPEVLMHGLIFLLTAYCLFNVRALKYFKHVK